MPTYQIVRVLHTEKFAHDGEAILAFQREIGRGELGIENGDRLVRATSMDIVSGVEVELSTIHYVAAIADTP